MLLSTTEQYQYGSGCYRMCKVVSTSYPCCPLEPPKQSASVSHAGRDMHMPALTCSDMVAQVASILCST